MLTAINSTLWTAYCIRLTACFHPAHQVIAHRKSILSEANINLPSTLLLKYWSSSIYLYNIKLSKNVSVQRDSVLLYDINFSYFLIWTFFLRSIHDYLITDSSVLVGEHEICYWIKTVKLMRVSTWSAGVIMEICVDPLQTLYQEQLKKHWSYKLFFIAFRLYTKFAYLFRLRDSEISD